MAIRTIVKGSGDYPSGSLLSHVCVLGLFDWVLGKASPTRCVLSIGRGQKGVLTFLRTISKRQNGGTYPHPDLPSPAFCPDLPIKLDKVIK